jgi:hypothetical protein
VIWDLIAIGLIAVGIVVMCAALRRLDRRSTSFDAQGRERLP